MGESRREYGGSVNICGAGHIEIAGLYLGFPGKKCSGKFNSLLL